MAQGDHLFFYRNAGTYSHHGIDTGEATVVHFDSSIWQKLSGRLTGRLPTIQEVTHEEFCQGKRLHVRAYDQCDPPEVAVERARDRIGESDYHVLANNCEHFAVWCKTGAPASSQSDAATDAARDWMKQQWMSIALARSARRLPPPYRTWAYGGALALAGTSLVSTYVRRRWPNVRGRES